jgi:hypothetical protein
MDSQSAAWTSRRAVHSNIQETFRMPQRPSAARRLLLRALPGVAAVAFAALAFHAPQAAAQAYPDKPVKIVVGFPPGGTNDILARLVAEKLQEKLKQSFIVENKPGAASAIGNDLVAKAAPDGYTLLVSSSSGPTTNPVLMKSWPTIPRRTSSRSRCWRPSRWW